MGKDDNTQLDRVWEIIEKTGICMMVTHFTGGLRARPLEARPDRDAETIRFLTDVRGLKDDEMQADSNVCLAFAYLKEKVYLSLTGKASTNRDPARARSLWNDDEKGWGPDGTADTTTLVLC